MASKPKTTAKAFTLTTTAALGGFDEGQALKSASDIVAYYRARVNEGEEHDLTDKIDDDAMLALIKSVDGDNADAEDKRVSAIIQASVETSGETDDDTTDDDGTDDDETPGEETGPKETPKQVATRIQGVRISATTRERTAADMAKRLDNDAELSVIFGTLADAKEEVARSAYVIWQHLKAQYGDEMDKFPVPGTQSIDKGKPYYTEDNADYFSRPSRRRGGGGGNASASWVDLFAENFKQIRDWRGEIEAAQKKAADPKLSYNTADYEAEKARLEGRINTCKGKVRLAITLHHTLAAAERFRQQLPDVAGQPKGTKPVIFEWIMVKTDVLDDNGNPVIDPKTKRAKFTRDVTRAEKCIWLLNPDAESAAQKFVGPLSIQGFCNYDFDAAIEKGGTFDDLLSTARRTPPDGYGWSLVKADAEEVAFAFSEVQAWSRNKANLLAMSAYLMEDNDENNVYLDMMDEAVQTWMKWLSQYRDRIDAFRDASKGDKPAQSRQSAPTAAPKDKAA